MVTSLIAVLFGFTQPVMGDDDNKNSSIKNAVKMIKDGKHIFRYDTFGDEAFWGDQLRLHEAIAGEANGGVGSGVSPNTALALGLKVDINAIPKSLRKKIARGQVDLDDPATTVALLKLNAVVGVTGFFDSSGQMKSIGIQCALCHSQVDNSFAPGIGRRLDGWANRDLNIGAIVAVAPDLSPFATLLGTDESTVRTVLNSWGPGKFDATLFLDGKAFRPDGKSAATLIPPAFGLAGVNLHTWTGWGSVAHWNALVAILEMGGKGRLYDPRLNDDSKFPIAAANGFADIRIAPEQDRVTKTLPALHMYQLSLAAPKAPGKSIDHDAVERGEVLFNGKAQCGTCHVPPLYTEPGWNLHKPEEIGIDRFQAERSPDGGYRTAPLKGIWTHSKGGFFHDGRFATMLDVINHYNAFFSLELNEEEKQDLKEFVYSL
jgi:cytochrome c peroxidase